MLSFIKQKALIIVVSDFLGLTGSWYKYMQIISQRFEIINLVIRDPRDQDIPKDAGQYIVEDPFSEEKLYVDANDYHEIYKKQVKENDEILRAFLNKNQQWCFHFALPHQC